MAYREVKIYDGEFPTFDQMISGNPTAPPFPKEVWLEQVQTGEYAVRYKNFKTGLARSVDGKHVQASEICRIFGDLEEARSDSRKVSQDHPEVICCVYDHTGAEVARVTNNKELNKSAVVMYAAILFCVGVCTLAGMGILWFVYRVALAILFPHQEPLHSLGWLGWLGFSVAGLLLGALAYFAKPILAARRVAEKSQGGFTLEERTRFEELNDLYGTADPKKRERFFALKKELEEKVRRNLKK